jgi:hypothetical protein
VCTPCTPPRRAPISCPERELRCSGGPIAQRRPGRPRGRPGYESQRAASSRRPSRVPLVNRYPRAKVQSPSPAPHLAPTKSTREAQADRALNVVAPLLLQARVRREDRERHDWGVWRSPCRCWRQPDCRHRDEHGDDCGDELAVADTNHGGELSAVRGLAVCMTTRMLSLGKTHVVGR